MLYRTYHLDLDFEKIISEAFFIEKEITKREYLSNKNGGVQIHENKWRDKFPNLYIREQMVSKIVSVVQKDEGRKISPYLWLNINYPKSYNTSHIHNGCFGSGVFYVKTPENSGNLIFTKTGEEIEPSQGMLILFDPSTEHAVSPNFSEDTRISFAFNY